MADWKCCQCPLCKGQEWPFHCGCGAIRRYDDRLTWCSDSQRHWEWEVIRDGRDGGDTRKALGRGDAMTEREKPRDAEWLCADCGHAKRLHYGPEDVCVANCTSLKPLVQCGCPAFVVVRADR